MAQVLIGSFPALSLADLGCPFEIGESILGHRLPGVTGFYNVHAYADELRKWLDR